MKSLLTGVTVLALVVLLFGLVGRSIVRNSAEPEPEDCRLGECPLDIYDADSGRTFAYTPTTRFTVWLGNEEAPVCSPEGIVGAVSSIPATSTPNIYPSRFEAVAPGECELRSGGFAVTIDVAEE